MTGVSQGYDRETADKAVLDRSTNGIREVGRTDSQGLQACTDTTLSLSQLVVVNVRVVTDRGAHL